MCAGATVGVNPVCVVKSHKGYPPEMRRDGDGHGIERPNRRVWTTRSGPEVTRTSLPERTTRGLTGCRVGTHPESGSGRGVAEGTRLNRPSHFWSTENLSNTWVVYDFSVMSTDFSVVSLDEEEDVSGGLTSGDWVP